MEAKERLGRIRILAPASGAIAAAPFLDLTGQISTDGERGLLGFAAAPDFATSGVFYVFVTRSATSRSAATAPSRRTATWPTPRRAT
ncbi:MAG TPA: hypothetical protein VGD19_11380 [Allosphingosinicella sp.]